MIYSVGLVSDVLQSDSVIHTHTHIYIFSYTFFSIIGYYMLNVLIVSCAIQYVLVGYLLYSIHYYSSTHYSINTII